MLLPFILWFVICLLSTGHSFRFTMSNFLHSQLRGGHRDEQSNFRGYSLAKNPRFNKGSSFSAEEKQQLGLRGLFPGGAPLTLEQKTELAMQELAKKSTPLEKYTFLHTIQDSDETLFYSILINHTMDVMPIVYTPVVGEACTNWHRIYRQTPRGLYISINDRGSIRDVLNNYPEKNIKVIVVTDGERILGLGDLGLNGMGIPIGKLALYTACAGIHPSACLPVHVDVGTNNEKLLNDPYYLGLRQRRVRGAEYDAFIQEFFDACKDAYGRNVLIQFEDFGNENAFRLLTQHENTSCCFNDDIQGTASVSLAGLLSSLPLCNKKELSEHTILFFGAGEAGVGIANQVAFAMCHMNNTLTIEEARARIWLVDSQGLICRDRPDFHSHKMAHHKLDYAHEMPSFMKERVQSGKWSKAFACTSSEVPATPLGGSPRVCTSEETLLAAIDAVRPTCLIGVSAQGQTFTPRVLEEMALLNPHPLIFALSNPTSKAECTAEEAYRHTQGRAIYVSGSPFDPLTLPDGSRRVPGQGNNAYIFPGVGLGALAAGALTINDEDFFVAACCLASMVDDEMRAVGSTYPPLNRIREASLAIAVGVADNIFKSGRASKPRPLDLQAACQELMYQPRYEDLHYE